MAAVAPQDIDPRPNRLNGKYVKSEQLAAEITELYAHLTAAEQRFLALVAEFDEKGYWELPGLYSCAHWLNWQCGIGMNAAREKVRVARALKGLPKIDASFARGEISYSKVRAITRVATRENEDYLLHFARHGTAHHVEKLIAGYLRVTRLQTAREDKQPQELREVTSRWDDDGCLVVTARLPAEQGALLLQALDLAVDRQFTAEREDIETGDVTAETPVGKIPRVAARRADALVEIAEHYLNGEAPTGSAGDRYQVVVHVTAETSATADLDLPRLDAGPGVTAETSRRLPLSRLHAHAFRRRAPRHPLGQRRRDRPLQPRAAVPPPSPPRARGRLRLRARRSRRRDLQIPPR